MPTFLRAVTLMLLWAVTVAATGQTSAGAAEPSGQYRREWLLCGPFPALFEGQHDLDAIRLPGMYTDFLKDSGGETNARPVAGQAVPFPGGSCVWKRHLARAISWI